MTASLPRYEAMIFFPGGDPAAGATIGVSMDGSNVTPLLFADSAATIPTPPPLIADGMGTIGFHAPPGLYLAWISGGSFRIGVDPAWPDPVTPDVYVHTQAAPANVWTIDHMFGTRPSVTLITVADQVESQISFPTATQVVVTFSSPQSGTATLRR